MAKQGVFELSYNGYVLEGWQNKTLTDEDEVRKLSHVVIENMNSVGWLCGFELIPSYNRDALLLCSSK